MAPTDKPIVVDVTATSPAPAVQVPDLDAAIAEIREFNEQRTRYIDAIEERLIALSDVLSRAVREAVDIPAGRGTALFDARVLLGLDGGTGARDIHAEVLDARA